MVRAAILNENNVVSIVYELAYFVSLGLHEDSSLLWEIDKEYKAFEGGSFINGAFTPPPPCEDCIKNHQ